VGKFDVIDIDPHGTAAPFMDAAIDGLDDGGLLCITCTDVINFASTAHPENAFALYGGLPLKGPLSHEGGLRLILNGIAASAAKYGLVIEPLLSLSIDFYARIFVRIHKSQAEVKFASGNTMLVYNCDAGCGAWTIQPLAQVKQRPDEDEKGYHFSLAQAPVSTPNCEHCGFETHLGGLMWAGPLHNPYFIQKILDMLPAMDRETYQTIDRLLTTALEEDLDKKTTPQQLSWLLKNRLTN
jgi:tRNA (guanine26-N2/guanine27-N2)-dimethyltransferase